MRTHPQPEPLAAASISGAVPVSGGALPTVPLSWQKPVLTAFGDVRELTMGPSPNSGESGFPLTLRT